MTELTLIQKYLIKLDCFMHQWETHDNIFKNIYIYNLYLGQNTLDDYICII